MLVNPEAAEQQNVQYGSTENAGQENAEFENTFSASSAVSDFSYTRRVSDETFVVPRNNTTVRVMKLV